MNREEFLSHPHGDRIYLKIPDDGFFSELWENIQTLGFYFLVDNKEYYYDDYGKTWSFFAEDFLK